MLKFSKANAKLDQLHSVAELQYWLQDNRKVYSFDLISGWSCPQAKDCLSKVVLINDKRKIKDGKDCQFRCFSASQEVVFPAVYDNRKANFDDLKSVASSYEMACMIADVMPQTLESAGFTLLVISSIKSISERGNMSQNGIQTVYSMLIPNRSTTGWTMSHTCPRT